MNGDVFESAYASAYDALYEDKDYLAECDLVEALFADAATEVRSIVDLGCGTGGHAWELARRGYRIVGVDRSEGMLAQARAKASTSAVAESDAPRFVQGDLARLDMGGDPAAPFDAAIMMFAVIGYLTEEPDLLAALRSVRALVKLGSVFVFDCWYGPAVVAEGPSKRTKTVPTADGRIERTAIGALDPAQDVCEVDYRLQRYVGEMLVGESEEQHRMRYFDEQGLRGWLEKSGFALERLAGFPDLEKRPDQRTWNVVGVARAAADR